jgi:hypothetical protein
MVSKVFENNFYTLEENVISCNYLNHIYIQIYERA